MSPQNIALCCAALALAACKATAPASEEISLQDGRPAVIVDPSAESRAELQRVVSDMLSGAEVTLAGDALTETSVLIIERARIRSLENPPLSGRDLGRPERFQLRTTGTECVLIHENSDARYELYETDCVPEE
jgi:hypothetical protein